VPWQGTNLHMCPQERGAIIFSGNRCNQLADLLHRINNSISSRGGSQRHKSCTSLSLVPRSRRSSQENGISLAGKIVAAYISWQRARFVTDQAEARHATLPDKLTTLVHPADTVSRRKIDRKKKYRFKFLTALHQLQSCKGSTI
jgi:hypothetical protein